MNIYFFFFFTIHKSLVLLLKNCLVLFFFLLSWLLVCFPPPIHYLYFFLSLQKIFLLLSKGEGNKSETDKIFSQTGGPRNVQSYVLEFPWKAQKYLVTNTF